MDRAQGAVAGDRAAGRAAEPLKPQQNDRPEYAAAGCSA
jgi:hypothetical protein